jgi:hypothetical protein
MSMSKSSSDRIIELWPKLPEEARLRLVEIAEDIAQANLPSNQPLQLSEREEQLLDNAREDFSRGRAMTLEECKVDLDTFFQKLQAGSKTG